MKKLALAITPVLMGVVLASPVFAADATDVSTLKAEIAKLSKEVKQLEAQSSTSKTQPAAAATDTSNFVTKGSFPGSFQVPGTNTSVKIGGYIKLDAIEDVGTGYGSSFAKFYALPLNNTSQAQQSSQTTFGAQQSRLNVETRTGTSLGELRTFLEGDFYNSSAPTNGNVQGYGLQLRHAYGSIGSKEGGQVLAGQTWSNFHDEASRPESLDYVGPAGEVFVRQPQVRYTQAVGPIVLSGSAEAEWSNGTAGQNGLTYVGSSANTTTSGQGKMPDLTLRAEYNYGSKSVVALRTLLSQISVDRGIGTNNYNSNKTGYGFAISGKHGIDDKDSVLYSVTTGKGTGRYVYDINTSANFFNINTGSLELQEYVASTLGVQHVWADHWRSNFFAGAVRIDNDTKYTGTTVNKFIASGHANLIWQPVDSYKVGLEYMHGYRKIENGEEGNLDRVEASFIYNF